jgi:hypothetical protein
MPEFKTQIFRELALLGNNRQLIYFSKQNLSILPKESVDTTMKLMHSCHGFGVHQDTFS